MSRHPLAVIAVTLSLVLGVLPLLWGRPDQAEAANFQMQTGSYIGTGVSGLQITGLGFTPDTVLIKSSTSAGVAVFKTAAMAANVTAFTSAAADNTATNVQLNSDGFTLGTFANVNAANVLYFWTAFTGSDCSAAGNYCVGSYTGNGSSPRTITTGFQPGYVQIKRSTAVEGHFRVASEPANETLFFGTTARDTAGNYIRSFSAAGFDVGTTDNANGGTYYYLAFKTTAGVMSQGTYSGNATDNRNITGVGFTPNWALIKNATSATTASRNPQMNFTDSHGDSSSYIGTATANQVNAIQALQADGFQVGTAAQANELSATFYWAAFGGEAGHSASGTFAMDAGTYVGTGVNLPISSLGFKPDLVIVKDNAANYAVFRTGTMSGDSTAYLSNALANFTGGVTSLDADGFTIGTNAAINTISNTYQWQAFGNAYNPYTHSGAGDFAVGAFYGNGIDGRDITRLPWQPDLVTVKRSGASAGIWRSSTLIGDLSASFGAAAEGANRVEALNNDGFQVGTDNAVNAAANLNHWFAFKSGSNFAAGGYTGTGSAQNITAPGFLPDLVWVKRSTAVNGVMRASSLAGNATQYFANSANVADRITALISTGFSVGGSQTETNTSAGTYRYAAWRVPVSGTLSANIVDTNGDDAPSPGISLSGTSFPFACTTTTGTLGISSQKARVNNTTGNPAWTLTIAATGGNTALWNSGGTNYDFNDAASAGCNDGADSDSQAGQLGLNPSVANIAPQAGCGTTGLSLGGSSAFAQAVTDSITLATASVSAPTNCYWDFTGIDVSQKVPAEKPAGTYTLSLTVTITAN